MVAEVSPQLMPEFATLGWVPTTLEVPVALALPPGRLIVAVTVTSPAWVPDWT